MSDHYEHAGDDRQDGIGASESPILMLGRLYGKTPSDLFALKCGIVADDFEESVGMRWGSRLETTILNGCNEDREFGDGVFAFEWQTRIRSRQWPWMTCTPDASLIRSMGDVVGLLQIKTTKHAWAWQDGPPPHVWCQIQHELAVTGMERGIALVFGPGQSGLEPRWSWVERDEEFIAKLVETTRTFWDGVQSGEMPPELIDGSEECRRILGKVFPVREPGSVADLGGEWVEMDAEMVQADADYEAAKLAREMLRNRIRHAMGEHEVATLPNGVVYTNRADKRGIRKLMRKESE